MTVEEFFDLIENDPDHRYEYIDGEVYMMTRGTRRHALLPSNVGSILGNLLQSKLCLVVEVLSPDSRSRDRGKKVQLYQDCLSIQDYLIVDAESPTVWHYQRQENATWTVQMLHLEDSIELISIGARCSVADIYEKTQFSK